MAHPLPLHYVKILDLQFDRILTLLVETKSGRHGHTTFSDEKAILPPDQILKNTFYSQLGKQCVDFLGASLLLLVLLPLMLITLLVVAVEHRSLRAALYRQVRLGKKSKPYKLIKFRSMKIDAEALGPQFSDGKHDPRITNFGRFIRKYRIDELPQLVNVIKGDMSLVGPRPERPIFHEKICMDVPEFNRRLSLKPGITGLAQVNNGYAGSEIESHRQKLYYDLLYLEELSLWQDLKIGFRTIMPVLRGEGV